MISQKIVQQELKRKGNVQFGGLDPKVVVNIIERARKDAYEAHGELWQFHAYSQYKQLNKELKPIRIKLEEAGRALTSLKQKLEKQTDSYF